MLKQKRLWLGSALTLVFLALFLYQVDFSQMGRALASANYLYVLPAVVVYFVGVWLRALRWRFLLFSLGKFSPHRLLPFIIIGFAVNNVIPARLGLAARAYLLGEQEGISKIASGATVVVDQIFDGLALLLFLGLIALMVPLTAWAKAVAVVAAVVFGGFFLLLLALAFSYRLTQRLAGLLCRILPSRWATSVTQSIGLVHSGLASLRSPWRLALGFLISILVWLTEASMYYIISLSFGLNQPFYVILLFAAIANIAITLPSLPGGVGPFEFFGKQTLTIFGVSEAVATAYAAVLHIALLLPVTLVGLALLGWRHMTLAQVTQPRKSPK